MCLLQAAAVCLLTCHALAAQQKPARNAPARQRPSSVLDSGTVVDNVYRNGSVGCTYKIPFGWVDRTAQMREDPKDAPKGQVLLAIFERPPEAVGESVNSAVTIAVESMASYPGLKTAADFFGPVMELTESMGLKAMSEPYELTIGSRQLVRGDFKKDIGTLTMYWTTMAMVVRGQVVSFTFVASREDEMEDLVGRLSLASGKVK
jgi:hypothetical protein